MSDKMRESFERWATGNGHSIGKYVNEFHQGEYLSEYTAFAWMAWQAAQSAAELDALRIAARALKALLDRDLSYVDNVVYFTFESHTQAINHIIDARNAADAAIGGEKQ